MTPARRHPVRLIAVFALAAALVGAAAVTSRSTSHAADSLAGVPRATCGPGSSPETGLQGQVPKADDTSGRAAQGYWCNVAVVGHTGTSGGFKVQRYVDPAGHVCAYYDTATMLGLTLPNLTKGVHPGVAVLDMSNSSKPVRTATLLTPAMLQPHESLLVNQARGLLVATLGSLATAPGMMDVYDVSKDCRHPVLRSTSVANLTGHESGFAPDGRTFWSAGAAGFTLTAIDLTDPARPKNIFTQTGVVYHGLRLSDDGRTLYVANMGTPDAKSTLDRPGLRILDVSEVQDRRPKPSVRTLGELTWPEASIPQVAEPFTRDGRQYVLENDEFTDWFGDNWKVDFFGNQVGAARIIDVTDPRAPFLVSRLRLEVHDPAKRTSDVLADPGGNEVLKAYAAHYCGVPTRDNPRVVGCSMIASGLRLFDISDLAHPREAAYFNMPGTDGGEALSQPAWDLQRGEVWYSDAEEGFFALRLTNGAADLLD
ncbi:LVIVD repeat-containing protein [Nocardioides sp. Kera G14]|uniref:LVIVD repeat-containing protein n=1 Tax=Nocardioides sp. Kera G14 TaxID=2884264 RepID=UPI001D10C156|nr:hypothetical protein [Nocardioides sp. Kera G14]UDY22258.1 hypothetical protein LH076_09185 [Nocardioides sp. Kera G14]